MDETKNILHGPSFTSPTFEKEFLEKTLDSFLIDAIEQSCNEVYMIDAVTNEKLMLKELLKKSYTVAAELQDLGFKRNSVVGIMSENRLEYPIVILGTILTGATITCFNPAYTVEEMKPILDISNPTIMFCSIDNYHKVKQTVSPKCKIIVLDSSKTLTVLGDLKFSQITQSTKTYRKVVNKIDDVVFILYSSGTTGLPKGVMLTHANIVFMMKVVKEEKLLDFIGLTAVSTLPMFHAFGLNVLLFAIIHNQTLITMRKYEERLFLSIIQKYKIKYLFLVPTLITFLLKSPIVEEYNLSAVKYILCGAAPIKPETEQAIKNKFDLDYVQQGYGLTETTLLLTIKNPKNPKPGTCGTPIPGIQIKVIHTENGKTLGKNEIGEICAKGPNIMKGYLKNEKATNETIDSEGWLHTGDIGYYDDNFDFFIVDRAKELIKYKGFQVAPAELEAFLLAHPAISDCAVIGIADEEAGELPRAYVVRREGANVTEKEIIRYIAEKVSPHKRIRGGVEFVLEIPKNPSGKILRRKLRESWASKSKFQRKSKL